MAARRIVCGDGVSRDDLERVARRYGWTVWREESVLHLDFCRFDDFAGNEVILLLGDASRERLGRALALPVSACIEDRVDWDQAEWLRGAFGERRGLALLLTTASAFKGELPTQFVAALVARGALPVSRTGETKLSLSEALANAIIHGNLELESSAQLTVRGFDRFNRTLAERLADSRFGARPVEVMALWDSQALDISVRDVGAGFDVAAIAAAPGGEKSGRGISFIQEKADSVWFSDGGRCITMRFNVGHGRAAP